MTTQIDADSEGLMLSAPAKLNLFLEVLGRRSDGYHDIVSVFQEIDLADLLTCRLTDGDGIGLSCTDLTLPVDERNLVVRAVRRLQCVTGVRRGLQFHLDKRIPAGSGLGGGSSDAAAALRLACRAWGIAEDADLLHEVASEIGSDVPFFLVGGTCLCEGRGERVTPLAAPAPLAPAVLVPAWGIGTREAYAALRSVDLGGRRSDAFVEACVAGDAERMTAEAFNRFEDVLGIVEPREAAMMDVLRRARLQPHLSGSGSAVWVWADTGSLTDRIRDCVGQERLRCLWQVKGAAEGCARRSGEGDRDGGD